MKKIIIYILIAVLLLGSLSVLIPTGDDDNVVSSGGGSSNGDFGGSSDDEGGDVPGGETSDDDEIKPVVLISEEQMLFGTTYTSADNSITFKTYPVYSKATVSDDLRYVTSNYFGSSIAGTQTWGEGNYFELTFPHQESGIYSFEYTINYYGTMPISHNYVKSNGYLNVVNLDLLDVSAEGVVDFSSDVGYTLTYLVSFDFDTNYMSVKISNVTGEYDFKLYEISLLGAENTGGVLADIQYRSGFYSPDIIDSSFEKIEVINLKYCYHPEGSSIVPDEVLEDNSGTIIEGDNEAYASSCRFRTKVYLSWHKPQYPPQ